MKKRLDILLLTIFAFVNLSSFALAQPAEKDKTKPIDFGSSLKPDYVKKERKPTSAERETGSADGEDVIRVNTELVVFDVMITDKQGKLVKNLTKNDFIVTEDKAPQQIETFSTGDGANVGRSIVLVMDYSGSMLPFIKTSVAAAKTLVDKLRPNDRMAIVTDNVELLTGFTHNKQLLKDKLDSLEASALKGSPGQSRQYSALFATVNELFDEEDLRPIVIFQTDGDELALLKENASPGKKSRQEARNRQHDFRRTIFSYEDVLTAIEKARATIYTIVPGTRFINVPESEYLDRARMVHESYMTPLLANSRTPWLSEYLDVLKKSKKKYEEFLLTFAQSRHTQQLAIDRVAKSTGGWMDYLETPEKADDVYTRVLLDIDNRYLLGYYPSNEAHDGKRRIVNVEVRNHPEYIVWGRKAYFAPTQK